MLHDRHQTIRRFKLFGDDGNFVESVLEHQREEFQRRYRLQAQGHDLEKILERVGKVFGVSGEHILGSSKRDRGTKDTEIESRSYYVTSALSVSQVPRDW
jgi:hypothetical protein